MENITANELPIYRHIIACTVHPVSAAAQELRDLKVGPEVGLCSLLEAEEPGGWIKDERSSHKKLEEDDDEDRQEQFLGAVQIMSPTKEPRKQENGTSLYRKSKTQHQSSEMRPILGDEVKAENDIQSKDRIIKQKLVKLSHFFIRNDQKAHELRF